MYSFLKGRPSLTSESSIVSGVNLSVGGNYRLSSGNQSAHLRSMSLKKYHVLYSSFVTSFSPQEGDPLLSRLIVSYLKNSRG